MPSLARPPSSAPRSASPGPILVLGALAALLGACVAPRARHEGSPEELGAMIARGGAKPVVGEVGTAPIDPADQPPPEPTATDVARLAAERSSQAEESAAAGTPEQEVLDLYIRFGERIVPAKMPDGTIFVSKPYILPIGKAQKVVDLVNALEPFPFGLRPAPAPIEEGSTIEQRPSQDPELVLYEILHKWDIESYGELTIPIPGMPKDVQLGDALVITAVPDLLERFESFIDLFGQVPQVELEAKIIEIVETESTDIGIRPVPGYPIFQFGSRNFVSAFDFNLSNLEGSTEALLTLGALQDGVTFNAVIEAVQKWDNVSVETRPKTIVRVGGTARLESAQRIPYLEIKSVTEAGNFAGGINYLEVGTRLYISPRVVGANTLALDVQLEGSQVVGYQETFHTTVGGTVSNPIVATRSARSLVYMEPGQTLLIGGLTRDRIQQIQSKIPILGDIPLLGLLFRSRYEVRQKEHVIFAISPRIVQRGDFDIEF
ncbi:MAG: hypothetical protein AB1726_04955 [Planctomycetota bacterium]